MMTLCSREKRGTETVTTADEAQEGNDDYIAC